MLPEWFIYIGTAISFIGSLSYIVATIKGKVQPNRITWLMWSIIPFVALAAQLKQGVGLQVLLTFIVGFNPLLIFIASFLNKKAFWKIGVVDITCGIFCLLGILLWINTKQANLAIILSVMADFIAAIPTLIKSYKFPQTESPTIFILATINSLIVLLTITKWDVATSAFAIYLFVINLVFALLILRDPKQRSSLLKTLHLSKNQTQKA